MLAGADDSTLLPYVSANAGLAVRVASSATCTFST